MREPAMSPLSADLIHGSLGLHELVAVDAVACALGADAGSHQRGQVFIRAAAPQDRPPVPFFDREQAVADLPFGRQPQAIAVVTEGLRDRIDESDASSAVEEAIIGRRLTGILDS